MKLDSIPVPKQSLLPPAVTADMVERGSYAAMHVLNQSYDIDIEDIVVAVLNAALGSSRRGH